MNYKIYSVKGTYPETGRKRTLKYNVHNLDDPEEFATTMGELLPPYEINVVPFAPPTDRQLEFANDLGINIPDDVNKINISYMIDSKLGNDSIPNPELVEFAYNRKILFSKYSGKKSLYNAIFSQLPLLDKIAFFYFSMYRYLSEDRKGNLDTHPSKDTFYNLATKQLENQAFITSMNKYSGEQVRFFGTITTSNGRQVDGGSTNTIAYKTASSDLNRVFGTPLTKNKSFQTGVPQCNNSQNSFYNANRTKKDNGSCLVHILLFLLTAGIGNIIYWLYKRTK